MGTIGGSHCRRHRNEGSASGTCGPTQDAELLSRYPTAGSSAKFRTFLRDQVKPFVEEHYRTSGADAVLGKSLAGLFVFETYLSEPELFGSYGAIDPSLWWDKEALSQTTVRKVDERHKGHALMLAVAKEQSEKPAAFATHYIRVAKQRNDLLLGNPARAYAFDYLPTDIPRSYSIPDAACRRTD